MLITNWQKGQEKLPDIVLSWESSLITGILSHYQGKLPDNQWLGG